jgi:hypothetical protein
MFKNAKTCVKENKNLFSFLFVLLVSVIIGSLIVWINCSENILGHSYRDIYLYLIEALKFAGYNIGGYKYVNYLSPLVPFLTSIAFRLGFVNVNSLFIITGIFYVLGVVGTYLLLRLRFDNVYSVFGAILYGSFTVNLMWAGNGSIDIPCVALSIWTLYFFIKGMNTNQKFLYLAFPLSILTFFAKYTGAVVFAVMILYFLSQKGIIGNIKKYFKNIVGGAVVGLLFTIPFFYFYLSNKLPFGFLSQAESISSTTTRSAFAIRKHKGNNLLYYFSNLPRYIYNPNHAVGIILLVIAVVGIVYGLYRFSKVLEKSYGSLGSCVDLSYGTGFVDNLISKIKIPKIVFYIVLFASIIGMFVSFFVAGKVSFVKCEILFFVSIFIFSVVFNKILLNYNDKYNGKYEFFTYDLMMIAWFMGHMIFLSAHLTKVDRYATAFAPALAFFITFGLSVICGKLKGIKFKNINLKNVVPVVFICIFIIMSFSYLTVDKHDSLVNNEQDTVAWLESHDANLNSTVIWADRGPIYTWYLQKEVHYVTNKLDPSLLSQQMLANNTKYYISQYDNLTIPHFEEVKQIGKVTVYQKV